MNDFVSSVRTELENASSTPLGDHVKTGDIRRISARVFKSMRGKSKDYVFSVCGELLEQRNWPMGVIAFDFAAKIPNYLRKLFCGHNEMNFGCAELLLLC